MAARKNLSLDESGPGVGGRVGEGDGTASGMAASGLGSRDGMGGLFRRVRGRGSPDWRGRLLHGHPAGGGDRFAAVDWLMTDRGLFSLALLLFAAATGYAVFHWRRGFSRDDLWCYCLLALAMVPHTGAMLARGFSLQRCPVNNLYEATMFTTWALLLCHLVIGAWPRLRFISAFAAPLLLGLGIFGLNRQLDGPGPSADFAKGVVSLHAALILLAYGTFGLSAASSVMYLMQERDMRFHKLRAVLSRLPSMERSEKVVAQALFAGLVLLSLGLSLSIWLVLGSAKPVVRGDPKVVWSLMVWVAYLSVLIIRVAYNRGARWLAWSSVGLFAFVILTFWGTNLLSPMHQS